LLRLFNTYFPSRTVVLAVSEAFLVCLTFVTATILCFGSDADLVLTYQYGLVRIAVVAAVFLVCMYYLDLYDSLLLCNRQKVWHRLLEVGGIGTLVLALLYYVYPEAGLGRRVFLVGIALVLPSLLFWRELFFVTVRTLRPLQRAIVIGHGPLACALAKEIHDHPEVGIMLMGYMNPAPDRISGNGLPYLGSLEQLQELVRRENVRQVVVAMGDQRGKLPVEELLALKTQGVFVRDGNELYETVAGKISIESLRLSWFLFSPGFHVSRTRLVHKRICSIILATIGIVLTFPIMILIGLAVRLDSPGPVIFRQNRVGKDGKIFALYKFRSMYDGAGRDSNDRPAEKGDSRFTRVGRWIRRARLDELPQLYNIFLGDMSFVGPRPFVPNQEREYAEKIPFYRQRWTVHPGATGWAQVNRGYCASLEDNAEKLAYDLFYIKNMCIGLDLIILLRTVKILMLGRGSR